MEPDELERRIRERLDALGHGPRAGLLHVFMLPDFERVGASEEVGVFRCRSRSRCSERRSGGHAKKHIAGGFEEAANEAIARVDEQADQLRKQEQTDWYAAVMDTTKPVLSYDPPTLGWGYVYFLDGREGQLV